MTNNIKKQLGVDYADCQRNLETGQTMMTATTQTMIEHKLQLLVQRMEEIPYQKYQILGYSGYFGISHAKTWLALVKSGKILDYSSILNVSNQIWQLTRKAKNVR